MTSIRKYAARNTAVNTLTVYMSSCMSSMEQANTITHPTSLTAVEAKNTFGNTAGFDFFILFHTKMVPPVMTACISTVNIISIVIIEYCRNRFLCLFSFYAETYVVLEYLYESSSNDDFGTTILGSVFYATFLQC